MRITLYHGTSTKKWEKIKGEGLNEPYLTSSLELAEYYAEVTSEDEGGEPIILEVEVDTAQLRYDDNAMCEPVGFDVYSISDLEKMVKERFRKLAKEHPEWCCDGIILIPETEYIHSLEVVASCWHQGFVKVDQIKILDEENEE